MKVELTQKQIGALIDALEAASADGNDLNRCSESELNRLNAKLWEAYRAANPAKRGAA